MGASCIAWTTASVRAKEKVGGGGGGCIFGLSAKVMDLGVVVSTKVDEQSMIQKHRNMKRGIGYRCKLDSGNAERESGSSKYSS